MADTPRRRGGGGHTIGRPPGSKNVSTTQVRAAVSALLEMSAPKMIEWLQTVADGIPEVDKRTNHPILTERGATSWVNKPDPKGAVDMVLKAAEFHIPKLARTEVVGDEDKPLFISKIELVPMHGKRADSDS